MVAFAVEEADAELAAAVGDEVSEESVEEEAADEAVCAAEEGPLEALSAIVEAAEAGAELATLAALDAWRGTTIPADAAVANTATTAEYKTAVFMMMFGQRSKWGSCSNREPRAFLFVPQRGGGSLAKSSEGFRVGAVSS